MGRWPACWRWPADPPTFAPDFLTEVVLYALSATNLTILVALVFVLARNIVKLLVEKRKALPFAHFRAKLVALMLGMTLIPAVLVLIAGSGVIRNSIDRWFNAPMDDVLSSANAIAGDYYQERQRLVAAQADRLARALADIDLASAPAETVRNVVEPDVLQQRLSLVEVFRIESAGAAKPILIPIVDIGPAPLPRTSGQAASDTLVARVARGQASTPVVERLPDGGDLIRSAVAVRSAAGNQAQGVVVASDYVTNQFAARSRRMTQAYEDYQQLRVLRQPLAGVYLSFFLMLTLMILVGSTWMGLYLTKRIIRPVQMLAVAANEIGAGHLDHRVEADTRDEFGSLIEAFNRMASDLSASRRRLEQSAIELEHKHHDVEGRRRYVETILERIATGVISVDTSGRIRTCQPGRVAPARAGDAGLRTGCCDGVRIARLQAARGGDRRSGPQPRRRAAARGVDHPQRPRDAPHGDDHTASPRGRRIRRHRPRARGRHAAGARAEGGRVAGRGAEAGARNQEPTHADSAVGRTPAEAFRIGARRRRASWWRSARRRSLARSSR